MYIQCDFLICLPFLLLSVTMWVKGRGPWACLIPYLFAYHYKSYRLVVCIATVKIATSTREPLRYRLCVFTELRVVITWIRSRVPPSDCGSQIPSIPTCLFIFVYSLVSLPILYSIANNLKLQSVRDLRGPLLRDFEKRAQMNNNNNNNNKSYYTCTRKN
jgi:hypothetical protein